MLVHAEVQNLEIRLDADHRLIAGAVAAANLFVSAASPEESVSQFCEAVRETCAGGDPIVLRIWRSAERIEAEVRRTLTQKPNHPRTQSFQGVDVHRHETQNGVSVTRLSKYLSRSAHRA